MNEWQTQMQTLKNVAVMVTIHRTCTSGKIGTSLQLLHFVSDYVCVCVLIWVSCWQGYARWCSQMPKLRNYHKRK